MFKWSAMPQPLKPLHPDGRPYYPDEVWRQLRLSSKSHWDVPVRVNGVAVHFLVSHPTPPVFDGSEDRNGCRNHDEIRFWLDYITGGSYVVDDQGRTGGLLAGRRFIIAGDLNADPYDGDGRHEVVERLLQSPLTAEEPVPSSDGAVVAAAEQQGANASHRGDASHDTGDFSDRSPGNLRADYVLPGGGLRVLGCGVFWPRRDELPPEASAWPEVSDHHPVWVDVAAPAANSSGPGGYRR